MCMKRFAVYPFLVVLFFLPLQTVYLLREPMIGGEKWQYGTMGIYATDILLILVLVLGAYCARYYVRRRTRSNFEGRKRSFSLLFARKQRASEKAVFAFQSNAPTDVFAPRYPALTAYTQSISLHTTRVSTPTEYP